MKNQTAHDLQWSVQSVSQYNLASVHRPSTFNRDFWAYTATNSASSYLSSYHVRSGLADDPSFHVENGLFQLHWKYLANEVWIDSPGGWLAIADGETGFGMLERFQYDAHANYPGKATIIFYKNGPSVDFDASGNASISAHDQIETPYYMEAEINSPLILLKPDATYSMDTTWLPLRTDADIKEVTEAGVVTQNLQATFNGHTLKLTGAFGVVVAGHLEVRLFDRSGRDVQHAALESVGPEAKVILSCEILTAFNPSRISVHLIGSDGQDRGLLDSSEVHTVLEAH